METEYHVDKKLKRLWEKNSLEKIKDDNADRVYIIDGSEGCGKSTFAIQQACYIEPGLLENPDKLCSRICFSAKEFRDAVRKTINGVIVFDEAFRGFSSRAAMSKINKVLVQTLMEMRQNNNIIFIVLPSFFLLDIYPAMLRSNGLFNIYLDTRNKKRCFRGYNKRDKNTIYQVGIRKGWTYPFDTLFKGRFYKKFPGGKDFEKAYLDKKQKSLQQMFSDENSSDDKTEIIKRLREQGKSLVEIGQIVGMSAEGVRKRLISTTTNINYTA